MFTKIKIEKRLTFLFILKLMWNSVKMIYVVKHDVYILVEENMVSISTRRY